jgi:low temperature requirement protein LtrA
MTDEPHPHLRPRDGTPQPTTAVELLFDLVYAFAVTQVSHLLIGDLSLAGAGHAAFLLVFVWWAWIYTTWMVNWFDPASSKVRLGFALWGPALALELAGPIVGYWTPGRGTSRTMDYPVDGGHFAERFQSFLIIVLGESIIVTGATASARGLTPIRVAALAVAFLITGGLWWLYFGEVAEHSRRRLATVEDPAVLARDAYSYLHLPIVAGVIMVAVGDDLLLVDPGVSLSTAGIAMLAGGPALFLLGEVLFRLRMIGSLSRKRLFTALGLCAIGIVARQLPALALAGLVAAVLTGLAAREYDGRPEKSRNSMHSGDLSDR